MSDSMKNDFEKCASILQAELETVRETSVIQKKIREAVFKKEWTDFEKGVDFLNKCALKLQILEKERRVLFEDLNAREAANFYEFSARFPSAERGALNALYRNLKCETEKTRLSGKAFSAYLDGVQEFSRGFLDALFKQRRGKLYSRGGVVKKAAVEHIILDKQF